jgi:hypothetical protein
MPTPEEKYYDGMNTLLAPVRAAKSLMQTVLIILLLLGAGLFYPIIQLCNEGHVTFGGFLVSFLTALFIFTFFYAPAYTFYGGVICFIVLGILAHVYPPAAAVFYVLFLVFFLPIGILQKHIRFSMRYGTGKWELCKTNIRYVSKDPVENLIKALDDFAAMAKRL